MKPRFRRYHGIWHCFVPESAHGIVLCGLGYTPKDAWIDWRILTNKHTGAAAVPSAATT